MSSEDEIKRSLLKFLETKKTILLHKQIRCVKYLKKRSIIRLLNLKFKA